MPFGSNEELSGISIIIRNGKVILTTDQVLEIYNCKLAFEKYNGIRTRGLSVSVSRMYQVSPKTIRDIWNHITWKPVTCHLWRSDMDMRIPTHNNSVSPGYCHKHNVWKPFFIVVSV
jgi:hypothetical protein